MTHRLSYHFHNYQSLQVHYQQRHFQSHGPPSTSFIQRRTKRPFARSTLPMNNTRLYQHEACSSSYAEFQFYAWFAYTKFSSIIKTRAARADRYHEHDEELNEKSYFLVEDIANTGTDEFIRVSIIAFRRNAEFRGRRWYFFFRDIANRSRSTRA